MGISKPAYGQAQSQLSSPVSVSGLVNSTPEPAAPVAPTPAAPAIAAPELTPPFSSPAPALVVQAPADPTDPIVEPEPTVDDIEVEVETTPEELDEADPDVDIQIDGAEPDAPTIEIDPELQPDAEVELELEPESDGVQLDLEDAAPAVEADTEETRVLVAEVDVVGAPPELEAEVYRVIRTEPGRTTTRSQLQEDINAVFATGFFSNVRAEPTDTPLGVRVAFIVQPNPTLSMVRIEGNQVLPDEVVDEAFAGQSGEILNLRDLQAGIQELNEWYQDNGYVLAQVTDAPQISEDGVVTLIVAEGVIEDISVQFVDEDGNTTDEDGEPIDGRTRDFIITREFSSQPGDVFNQQQIERDLQRVFGLGIFDDVQLGLSPGSDDPRKVDIVVSVDEGQSGSVAAGVGFSTTGDLFGTISYQEQNLGGNNQKLGAEVQLSGRELLFDINFTDPWIAGDPYGTSYNVNIFNRRSISLIFDGGETEVRLPPEDPDDDEGDRPRIDRLGGGVSFTRPFDEIWTGSLGFQYQRVTIRDGDRDVSPVDELGNDLSLSGTGRDDLWTVRAGIVQDLRNSPIQPTQGSLLRFATEQSVPLGAGSAFFNRLRASYSYYMPVDLNFLSFNRDRGQEVLAFNVQAGTILGDFPPYEAFALGGSNSVRGYDEGDLGSGQSFIQATVEYRFPFISIVDGALFLDAATDLGTGDDVIGDPAGVRDKPGSGIGVGVGVRVQSPLGPIRVDYGFNDQGDGRLHFGIGERF